MKINDSEVDNPMKEEVFADLDEIINIDQIKSPLFLSDFSDYQNMAKHDCNQRLLAAVQIIFDCILNSSLPSIKIDTVLIDYFIAQIDDLLSAQMDEIIHHHSFKKCESLWRGLSYLVHQVPQQANVKIEILNISKTSLSDNFKEQEDLLQTDLYRHIYVDEYDTPGGEPISAIISNFEFDASSGDIFLLKKIAEVVSLAHSPFIANVSPSFFHKKQVGEIYQIKDLQGYLSSAEYIGWKMLRQSDAARYLGLTLPRFLLRLPYGQDNSVKSFGYEEDYSAEHAADYLWGSASFPFAANMIHSFSRHGWAVNIRGPQGGGRVRGLPLHYFDMGRGWEAKIPTEVLISEAFELELSELGFIPLSYYKHTDYACFFSANSIQMPALYDSVQATANSRINSRLPYIFLISRIAHYLKVLQRENIGTQKPKAQLEQELNAWLKNLVTHMNHPGAETIAKHPLREAKVVVDEIADNPGYYRVHLYIVPHFQVEGLNVRLSLVSRLPRNLIHEK